MKRYRTAALAVALFVCVGLPVGCATISAWLSPPIRCDRLTLTTERDPGASLPVVAARCGSRLVWRDVCRSPDVSQGWLYCDGVRSVAIAGDVTRSAQ